MRIEAFASVASCAREPVTTCPGGFYIANLGDKTAAAACLACPASGRRDGQYKVGVNAATACTAKTVFC